MALQVGQIGKVAGLHPAGKVLIRVDMCRTIVPSRAAGVGCKPDLSGNELTYSEPNASAGGRATVI
jgi:hypothetical protein